MRGRRSVRAKRARCVCVCAPRYNLLHLVSFLLKKKTQQNSKQPKNNNQKPVKENLGGSFKTLRDAIRCCARTGECLTNSLHANEERVQLETKYNRSNQIAYRRYPNKTLLLRWPFARTRLFLCNLSSKAKTKASSGP